MQQLLSLLSEQEYISAADSSRAQALSTKLGIPVSQILSQLGLVGELKVAETIAQIMNIEVASPAQLSAEWQETRSLNIEWLKRKLALPVNWEGDELTIAMANPYDQETLTGLEFATGKTVRPMVATPSDIREKLAVLASTEHVERDDFSLSEASDEDIEKLLDGSSEAPVIRLVNAIIANAIRKGASDIHIEPMSKKLAIRFRIDGRLVEVESHAPQMAAAIASRIKIISELDISETRLPQDGRLKFTHMGEDIDIRVSTSPIANGESIVLRLLGQHKVPLELDRIGLPEPLYARLAAMLERPNGIILVTGPTGSGKTTTLYAALNRLRSPEVKILTVEDPVEIILDGVNQVQIRPDIGLDYAGTLRAFLRQDPDILMVGEIRDRDTADIALRAALTGHLVLSTLHTNNALGAFTRLSDLGIDNFLTASTVIASIAQRLLRTLCTYCKIAVCPNSQDQELFRQFGIEPAETIYEPKGCSHCAQTGYTGRAPIMEFVRMDGQLRDLVHEGRTDEFQIPAEETLSAHALELVRLGQTSIAEALRVTGG